MKVCQFYRSAEARSADLERRVPVEARLGVLIEDRVVDVTEHAARHHEPRDPQHVGVLAAAVAADPAWAGFRAEIARLSGRDGLDPAGVFFAPCILRPSQFLDFYAFEQHVRTARKLRGFDAPAPEWYQAPHYYNSNPTSLIGHGMTAAFPPGEERMDYECELACVMGRSVRNATLEEARQAIAGYTILNDLSARARQSKAMPVNMGPSPGKDFASALGPWLVTPEEISDWSAVGMRAFVNGEQWTDGRFGTIHYSFEQMIVYASVARRLFPGDVLGSGTVGGGCGLELGKYLKDGDVVRIEIDGLGVLENPVGHEGR